MTEERDAGSVSRRYRELGAEEPPRALDDAILAAARTPARFSSRRWAVPLSLAAVVVLSVTVTLNLQHEAPEIVAAQAPRQETKARDVAPAAQAAKAPESAVVREAPKEAARREAPGQKPFAADPPPVAAEAPAIASGAERDAAAAGALSAPRREAREDQAAALARAAPATAPAPAAKRMQAQETPELELERIALLRKDGRHDEADKALADFRKRHPEFRIPEPMLERVEKR